MQNRYQLRNLQLLRNYKHKQLPLLRMNKLKNLRRMQAMLSYLKYLVRKRFMIQNQSNPPVRQFHHLQLMTAYHCPNKFNSNMSKEVYNRARWFYNTVQVQ